MGTPMVMAQMHRTGFLAVAIAGLGVALTLPQLGEHGIWTLGELSVLDRALGALGEGRSGLLRAPWLPDALRAWSYGLFGGELGLRLPHAAAVTLLATLTVVLARLRGTGSLSAAVAGLVVLAMPATGVAGRTALGNPFGELFGACALVWALTWWRGGLGGLGRWTEPVGWLGVIAALAAGVAASGLCLGGCVPLLALAIFASTQADVELDGRASNSQHRWRAAVFWAAALIGLVAVAVLVWGQKDGYIPLLGAAKDLELIDKPELRRFPAGLADMAYQTFPWLPLALVGAAVGRDRGVALWLLCTLVVGAAWSLGFGPVDFPVRVPVALSAATGVGVLADHRSSPAMRGAVVWFAVLGALVLAKDLELAPEAVAVPQLRFGFNEYPATLLETQGRFSQIAWCLVAALVGGWLAGPRRLGTAGVQRLRTAAPTVLAAVAALVGAWTQMGLMIPASSLRLSPKHVLGVHAAQAERGELAATLGVHRVRDRGLAWYARAPLEDLPTRQEVLGHLAADPRNAALVRELDVPALYQQRRMAGEPMVVLDDSHAQLRLIAPRLPPGLEDRNRIPEVLSPKPFELAQPTLVRFEDYVEVIGWEVSPTLVRGGEYTLQLSLRVLKPPPAGTKVYARFLGGRLSRINGEPQEPAEGLYPPNLWRAGDFILHRFTFRVPLLGVHPGSYDFVVALRRSESKNFSITQPEGKTGEFGVRVRDSKRAFAELGQVQVW